ncbi:MAG TPA: hypothetical protein VHK91_08275 [Flavisolibacter sp.]|jgi:hypothetical protein|nr:hypothetical protein [Flavisolibacter sp.]
METRIIQIRRPGWVFAAYYLVTVILIAVLVAAAGLNRQATPAAADTGISREQPKERKVVYQTVRDTNVILQVQQLQKELSLQQQRAAALVKAMEQQRQSFTATIGTLQADLRKKGTIKAVAPAETAQLNYAAARGESAEELRQRNINLKLAYDNLMTRSGVLNKAYNQLQQKNVMLTEQLRLCRANN